MYTYIFSNTDIHHEHTLLELSFVIVVYIMKSVLKDECQNLIFSLLFFCCFRFSVRIFNVWPIFRIEKNVQKMAQRQSKRKSNVKNSVEICCKLSITHTERNEESEKWIKLENNWSELTHLFMYTIRKTKLINYFRWTLF